MLLSCLIYMYICILKLVVIFGCLRVYLLRALLVIAWNSRQGTISCLITPCLVVHGILHHTARNGLAVKSRKYSTVQRLVVNYHYKKASFIWHNICVWGGFSLICHVLSKLINNTMFKTKFVGYSKLFLCLYQSMIWLVH